MLAIVKVERQGIGGVFRANLAPNRACAGGRRQVGACEATARPTWSNGYATIERVNFSVRAMSNEGPVTSARAEKPTLLDAITKSGHDQTDDL